MEQGTLIIEVTTNDYAMPVSGAQVTVQNSGQQLELTTDQNGRTPVIGVRTPDRALSQQPNATEKPYSLYNVTVQAQGYPPVQINGVQAFPGIESVLPVDLTQLMEGRDTRGRTGTIVVDIPENALESNVPRQPEAPQESTGLQRILTNVYIPETVTVHLGRPTASARNVTVSFLDYIKNVASSEIYPTWPENALRANIHAQVGFVLNRIFTEWYTSRGYDFNITNSTAYDQSFVEGRNIFSNISRIVDEIFNIYPRRQGHTEPLFSSYCNGSTVTCAGLSQWGTVNLANSGYTPLQIIRYYYGQNVDLVETNDIRGIEESYPGFLLRRGSENQYVRTIQQQLMRVRQNYPAIPAISSATGFFGSQTEAAVRAFQRLFGLTVDGIVGRATWYQLSYIYAAVKRLAELDSEGEPLPETPEVVPYPGYLIKQGARGSDVRTMQQYLRDTSRVYSQVPTIEADGIFGPKTLAAVRAFQRLFGLTVDGIVGPRTWNMLTRVWSNL